MDDILECFFNDVFSEMERSSLFARYKRRQMVEYLSTVIQGCGRVDGEPKQACNKCVLSAIAFHKESKIKNGGVCLMGKFHNILYVAARLAFDWNLEDSLTISNLLNDMFQCEKTFDRIIVGAIFGPRASGVISGWKSDFDTREENLNALKYFFNHSSFYPKTYKIKDKNYKIVDVPVESYGGSTAAMVAVQITKPDILLLLLQYGATVYVENSPSPFEVLLRRLSESTNELSHDLNLCLNIILRTIGNIPCLLDPENATFPESYQPGFKFIPEERLKSPCLLKHLCRINIRMILNDSFQLPLGINNLPVPDALKQYINIEID